MKLSGHFYGKLINHRTGEVICWDKSNMVVQSGFNWIANLMMNKVNRSMAITHIAFGTGTSTTTSSMTTLEKEVYRAEVTAEWDQNTRELVFSGEIPTGSGLELNITEVGLFNADVNGTLFDRATFSPKGIDNDTSFTYHFKITLTE